MQVSVQQIDKRNRQREIIVIIPIHLFRIYIMADSADDREETAIESQQAEAAAVIKA